jgi:ComF family protein
MGRWGTVARLVEALRAALADCAQALYPRACRLCGARSDDGIACAEHRLPEGPGAPRCARCAVLLPGALPDGERCAACRRDPPGFVRCVALADYRRQPGVQAWVLALKHGGRADLGAPLGALLARRLRALGDAGPGPGDVLVPVPLHPLRRLERGHDQARAIARGVSTALGLAWGDALVRVRATPAQGAPGAVSRTANVHAAFACRARAVRRLAGRAVWLVDDIVTSGSTASECARILRRAGAGPVTVVCLARAGGRAEESEPDTR